MLNTLAYIVLSHTLAVQTSEPRIVIVPPVNVSGEKWVELKEKQTAKIEEYLLDTLPKRGFSIAPRRDVEDMITRLNIDFTDEEQQKRATLYALGREMRADFIYFPLIVGTEQGYQDRDLFRDREGRTAVKVWLLDVRNEKAILSAKPFVGRSGGMRITLKPSDRQIQAAANAVRDSLVDFLKSYPVTTRN